IANDVKHGNLEPNEINESEISKRLFTFESPDPDLLIRTGGDHRISNFLLWQLAYAELYFTDICWPEFTVKHLHEAIESFRTRERRFGKVPSNTESRDER